MINNIPKDERQLIKPLAELELKLIEKTLREPTWLSKKEESVLQWALSLARISAVCVRNSGAMHHVEIGHATDIYRKKLHALVTVNPIDIKISEIAELAKRERLELLDLYAGIMPASSLDDAVRVRPLALALSGGGGTSYIFAGALAEFEDAGIRPAAIAGASMGAIIGAYRARYEKFDIGHMAQLMQQLTYSNVIKPVDQLSRFSVPATFRLVLRDTFGPIFSVQDRGLKISELAIPFRAVVAGLAHIEGQVDPDLSEYAHLLDNVPLSEALSLRKNKGITQAVLQLARKPLRATYLGGDELTREFDVLDAIGFSAAIPGVFQYDVAVDDVRMASLVEKFMRREGVFRLFDGGFADNLPAVEAYNAAQTGDFAMRDPFVLALDGFAPMINSNWMYLPMMQYAAAASVKGREFADLTITYKNTPSPIAVVLSEKAFVQAIENGRKETAPHIPLIKKILGPITDPKEIIGS